MAPSSPVDEERGDSDQIMSDPGQFMSDPVEPQLPAQLDLPASEVGPSILTAALGSDTGSSFRPMPTSDSDRTDWYSALTAAEKAEMVIDASQLDKAYAQRILDRFRSSKTGGVSWLRISLLRKAAIFKSRTGARISLPLFSRWCYGQMVWTFCTMGINVHIGVIAPGAELLATSLRSRLLRIMPGKVAWCGSNVIIVTSSSLFACMIRAALRQSRALKTWRTSLPMVCVAFF